MGRPALSIYYIDQAKEWDDIVKSFFSDVYYLSGYVKAFQAHGDGEPILFYYDDGKNRGINVSMKRSISRDFGFREPLDDERYFDLSTPYGYGGWIIEGDSFQLFKDYERWCQRNNIVSEFVRFHPILSNYTDSLGHYDIVNLGNTVAMELNSPENIWENITSKNRNAIRKAMKSDIKIYNGRFPKIFDDFKRIYDMTMTRDEATEYYYFGDRFYSTLLNELPNNAQIFWAEKEGVVIAASIILECNGFMSYHLSGGLKEYSTLAPTNLLLYKAALWGCEHGIKRFHLGGGVGSEEDSLFKFKKSFFKGELHSFHIGKKVFNNDAYQELTMLREGLIKDVNFFPVYRG